MASNAPCLTNERINEVIFEAENKALEELLQNPKWDPTETSLEIPSINDTEQKLFNKVLEVAQRCYRMGKGTYGLAGGARKTKKNNRSSRGQSKKNNRSRRS